MKQAIVYVNGRKQLRCGVADNYFLRLRGLIGRDPSVLGGLWIKPCNQIHTCFMRCPIDVVYLQKDGTVFKVEFAAEPGRFFPMERTVKSVLELPSGDAERLKIKAGDLVNIKLITGQK